MGSRHRTIFGLLIHGAYWLCLGALVVAGTISVAIQVFGLPRDAVSTPQPGTCSAGMLDLQARLLDHAQVALRRPEMRQKPSLDRFLVGWDQDFRKIRSHCGPKHAKSLRALEAYRFRTSRMVRAFRNELSPLEKVILPPNP